VKQCKKCLETRDFIAFYKRTDYPDGYSPNCKLCRKSGYNTQNPDLSIKEKTCPDCKQLKSISEFGKNRNSRTGYATYCKPCASKRTKERYHSNAKYNFRQKLSSKLWREEHPERHKLFVRQAQARYAARKRAALAESRSSTDKALAE